MDVLSKEILVKNLRPIQSEIDLQKVFEKGLSGDLTEKITGAADDNPIVVFNEKNIIDGHHRWATQFLIDPDGSIFVLSFNSNEKLNDFLERFKTARASNDKIKVSFDKFLGWDEKKQRSWINDHLDDYVVRQFCDWGLVDDSDDWGSCDVGRVKSITYLLNNIKKLSKIKPETDLDRKDMPQLTAKEEYLDKEERFL